MHIIKLLSIKYFIIFCILTFFFGCSKEDEKIVDERVPPSVLPIIVYNQDSLYFHVNVLSREVSDSSKYTFWVNGNLKSDDGHNSVFRYKMVKGDSLLRYRCNFYGHEHFWFKLEGTVKIVYKEPEIIVVEIKAK